MLASLFVLLILPENGQAQESIVPTDTEEVEAEAQAEPELTLPGTKRVNVTHGYLSTSVEKLSRWIDGFFGEDRVYEESSGTYVQARVSSIYGETGEIDFDSSFRAKVDLPQLQERVNIVLESEDDSGNDDNFERITSGSDFKDDLNDSDVTASVQFMIKEKERWNFSIRPGLRISSPIESYVKFRFRRNQPLGPVWNSRGTVEFKYNSDYNWEDRLTVEFERDIGDKNFFRSISTAIWDEDDSDNCFLGQAFQVTHFIDRHKLISFEIGTTGETEPHLRNLSYFSNIRYRKDIHRGWLFLEIKPQIVYTRENDYEAEEALVLTLEMLFGGRYLE